MALTPNTPPITTTSVTDNVFGVLLDGIVRGVYPEGARLPAERELAQQLGASRSALREAIRRLTSWCLVEPRRGSGVAVLPRSEWAIDVLPAYVKAQMLEGGVEELKRSVLVLRDMLQLRRVVIAEVLAMVGDRAEAKELAKARQLLDVAWAARHQPVTFVEEDFRMMRAVALAAGMMPAVWMLNSLAGVYLGIARQFSFGIPVTHAYFDAQLAMFAALEQGDGKTAAAGIAAYLQNHDNTLLTALEVLISP